MRWHLLLFITLALACGGPVHADIEVNARLDTIVMNDGTEVQCLILMMSPSGIVIVETDPKDPEKRKQRTVPRNAIRNIVIGERSARTEELLTDTEFARKVVLSSGPRKDDAKDADAAAEKGDGAKHPASSKKSNAKKKELAGAEKKTDEKDAAKPAAAPLGAKPPAPDAIVADAPIVLPPESMPPKELIAAYLSRYPDLQSTALDIAGEQRIQEWIDGASKGNQSARQPIDALLNVYLGNVSETARPGVQIKSALPTRANRYAQPDAAK